MQIVVELTEREADELLRAQFKARRAGTEGVSVPAAAAVARELESAQRKLCEAIDGARVLARWADCR